jgi:hypothetical protein
MTPIEKFISDSHRETGTRPRKPTKAELWLAERLFAALGHVSWGFVRGIPERSVELRLDTKVIE